MTNNFLEISGNIKFSMDTSADDIVTDFFIPCLSRAISYDVGVGYFTSGWIKLASKGLASFIGNGGFSRWVINPDLQEDDWKAIKKGTDQSNIEVITNHLEFTIKELEDALEFETRNMLSWLIAENRLTFRIAIPTNSLTGGIWHPKFGVIRDSEGSIIAFDGSYNMTAHANLNWEKLNIYRSWIPEDTQRLNKQVDDFKRIWDRKDNNLKVYDIHQTVVRQMIDRWRAERPSYFPQNGYPPVEGNNDKPKVEETNQQYKDRKTNSEIPDVVQEKKLYDYQEEAIQKWFENGKSGILEMATGTGKTFTALGCLQQLSTTTEKLVTIISCPYQHLAQQWKREVESFGFHYPSIVADGNNPKWRNQFTNVLIDISLGHRDKIILYTTHHTFSSLDFRTIIRENSKNIPILAVVDEVHGTGATESQKGLINEYSFRLGLSATPKRWFDQLGTNRIYQYFKGVVFEFPLRLAIRNINPRTGETFLTPYKYLPLFVSLTHSEIEEYEKLTKKITKKYHSSLTEVEREKALQNLVYKRADIVKNAEAKYEQLVDIIKEIGSDICWTIIYSSPKQHLQIMDLLNDLQIINKHEFTMREGTKPELQYDGLSEREYILKKFADKEYRVLVAMKCLDEGVDVPPAREAILMASSGNPREYIQRIGRVIRRYTGKNNARIFDIIVKPDLRSLPSELKVLEMKIFNKELDRSKEIAQIAINNTEALNLIFQVEREVKEVY